MKSNNHTITDEHIVAYLDGELNASPEFKRELSVDPSLAIAAKEYAAIGKAMASSRADSRFMLSASVDARTKKMLADSLSKSRKAVRTAGAAPNASPVRSVPATRSIKFIWARRASVWKSLVICYVGLKHIGNPFVRLLQGLPQVFSMRPSLPVSYAG